MDYRGLLRVIDSQETASIKEARKLLVAKAGMSEEDADKWVRGDLRAAFPILRDKHAAKFILGTTRLFVEQQLNDADAQNKLTRVLKEVNSEDNYEKFDRNLNGLSLGDLYGTFEEKISADDKASRDASGGKSYSKSEYKITGPFNSFKEAKAAWGNKSQDWCVFHRKDMFDSYTSAGQVFYVAAKNGWESVPRKVGENAPMDEYGNSLIAISVDVRGNLATSTPRWNHANGGGDHTYTVDELESILQVPFYDTFKPSASDAVATWGDGDVVRVVKVGSSIKYFVGSESYPKAVFTGWFSVTESGIKPKFKEPIHFYNEAGECNYLRTDGSTFKVNADIGRDFHEGFAAIKVFSRDHKGWNYVGLDGKLLSDQWFDQVYDFRNGFGKLYLSESGANYIKKDGTLLLDTWVDNVGFFYSYGCAIIRVSGKGYNLVDQNGSLLSDTWYNRIGEFSDGLASVTLVGKGCNYIKPDGTLLSDEWFYDACTFEGGCGLVARKDGYSEKCNFIKKNGKFLSDEWFDEVDHIYFQNGIVRVGINGKGYNILRKDGTFLLDKWTSSCSVMEYNNYTVVSAPGRHFKVNKSGKIVDSAWKVTMGLLKKVQL